MISGASEQELELANARANIVIKLDNTSTYESWLIIDTYLEQLEKENQELKKQQKGFIKYMNDIIKDLETEDVDDEEMKGYLIQRIDTFKEILQKYKSIIGGE